MGQLTVRTWFDFGVRWSPKFCSCAANRGARAPELPLPRTHFVARGGTLQRTPTWQRLGSHSQRCCGGMPDPAMGQNRQPFGDVHPARGDGQPPATFKRRAEISSHTEKMCSTTAPQGMQGVYFFAETEERKQARIISPEIAWRHTHQTLCRLAFTTEIPKQTGDPVLVKPRSSTTVSLKCIAYNENRSRRQARRPGALVPTPDLQYLGPPLEGLAVHAGASRVAARSSTFSKRLECAHATSGRNDAGHPMCIQPEQEHLQPLTALPRNLKVPHPSAKLYRARVCQKRPDNERNSTTFAGNAPG